MSQTTPERNFVRLSIATALALVAIAILARAAFGSAPDGAGLVKNWNRFCASVVAQNQVLRELDASLHTNHPQRVTDARRLELYTVAILEAERQAALLRAMRKAEFGRAGGEKGRAVPEIKVQGVEALLSLDRQITFAAAQTLTGLAKQGQAASQRAIQSTFVTRGRWYLASNALGVRVKPARRDDLEASVHSGADFLKQHETGGVKRSRSGKDLAIAIVGTGGARPRITSKLRRELKPGALGGKAFRINTRSGPVLFYRRGKKQKLTALYTIEKSGRIRKQSVIVEPVTKVVFRRAAPLFVENLKKALASAK